MSGDATAACNHALSGDVSAVVEENYIAFSNYIREADSEGQDAFGWAPTSFFSTSFFSPIILSTFLSTFFILSMSSVGEIGNGSGVCRSEKQS